MTRSIVAWHRTVISRGIAPINVYLAFFSFVRRRTIALVVIDLNIGNGNRIEQVKKLEKNTIGHLYGTISRDLHKTRLA